MDAWMPPLAERLDLLALITMAFVSKAGNRAVVAELRERLKRGRFVVVPLVDGTTTFPVLDSGYCGDDSETESVHAHSDTDDDRDSDAEPDEEDDYTITHYDCCPPITLAWEDGMLRGPDGADGTFRWHGMASVRHKRDPYSEYRGQKLKVYWTPAPEDGVDFRSYGERAIRRGGIDLAEIRIDEERPANGERVGYDHYSAHYGDGSRRISLRYEIMEQVGGESTPASADNTVCARIIGLQVPALHLLRRAPDIDWPDPRRCTKAFWRYIVKFLEPWTRR